MRAIGYRVGSVLLCAMIAAGVVAREARSGEAQPPGPADIICLPPQEQLREINELAAEMKKLVPTRDYPDPFKLPSKSDVGNWPAVLDWGEACGNPAEMFMQYPQRTRYAIYDVMKRMGGDISCTTPLANTLPWEPDIAQACDKGPGDYYKWLFVSRAEFTQAVGLRWMPWLWQGRTSDDPKQNELERQVSDKGIRPANHCPICPTHPNNIDRWVKALAASHKMANKWLWQVNGKSAVYWDAEDAISTPGQKDGTWQFFCYCDSCKKLFRAWLQRRYKDAAPNQDTNGDRTTLNGHCGTAFATWDEVAPPAFEQREAQPVLFWMWMKFREWSLCIYKHQCVARAAGVVNISPAGPYGNWGMMNEAPWHALGFHLGMRFNDVVVLTSGRHGTFWSTLHAADSITRRDSSKIVLAGANPRYDEEPFGYIDTFTAQAFSKVSGVNGLWHTFWGGWGMLRYGVSEDFHTQWYPERSEQVAWWNWFGERQHDLLADMKTSEPRIAVLFPWTAEVFERCDGTPYSGWANSDENFKLDRWADMALSMLGYPFHVISEDQVTEGALKDYKVLYLLSNSRVPPEVAQRIKAFYDAGGYVYIGYNSLSESLAGKPDTAVFEQILGVRPAKLYPSTYMKDELDALKQTTGGYVITADHPALPPKGTNLPCVNGMMTVEPVAQDVQVLATFNGQPCITARGRAIFVGTRIGVDVAMTCPFLWKHPDEYHQISFSSVAEPVFRGVLKVLHGFADTVGAGSRADVLDDGKRPLYLFSGMLDNWKLDAHLIVLGNYESIERDHMVRFTELLGLSKGTKYDVLELKTQKMLERDTDGKVDVFVPNGGVRMLLVAPRAVVEQAAKVQADVQKRSELFDFLCARKFFYRYQPSALPWEVQHMGMYGGAGSTLESRLTEPNCLIVLPDKPDGQDEAMAQQLQALIQEWPLGMTPLTLPVKRAGAVTLYDRERYNLFLIGGPKSNKVAADFAAWGLLTVRNPDVGIGNVLRRHWKDGGNVLALMGENAKQRQKQYAAFIDWMKIWFESADGYRPKAWWVDDLKEDLGTKDWTYETDGVCDLVAKKQGAKEVHVFLMQTGKTVDAEALKAKVEKCQARGAVLKLAATRSGQDCRSGGQLVEAAAASK